MSKLTKKQDFEWFQDQTSLKINYPIKGISIKKIDIYFAPYFIKLNVSERNQVKYFDLMYEIDYTSKENTILYINDVLEIRVIKKDPVKWEELSDSSLSKEQIMKRRQDSIQRKEEYDHKFKKNLDDLKIKHDRHSVSEQMRLEQNEREWLESKKKEEKEHAEEELYADLDENKQFVKKENEIFDGNEINDIKEIKEEEEIKEIPEIRGQKAVQLKFTEKVYPNLATRETHMKEAPFPKIKHVTDNKDSKKDIENENPLWLKDKGDEFYKNKDYYSAINAYNLAYKKDDKLITCIANRSACHLNLFNFIECIDDCNSVINYIEKLPEIELNEKSNKQLILRLKWRKAIALSWSGELEKAEILLNEIKNNEDSNLKEQIEISCKNLLDRKSSIKIKKLADIEFKTANYEKSLSIYKKSLEIDPNNEIVLSNISLILFKNELYKESLEYLQKSLDIIEKTTQHSNFSQSFRQSSSETKYFLIKLLLRKVKIHKKLNECSENKDILKRVLQLEDNNKEAIILLKEIQEEEILNEISNLKFQASNHIKENNFTSALLLYNECLKKINQKNINEIFEYLSILLNKCVCHFHLNEMDDIINLSIRGIKLIKNLKNRVISIDQMKISQDEKNKLNDFEIRFLVRRSNAYLKQNNQIYNAKSDLEEALKLNPDNYEIIADLERIKKIIN